MKSLIETDRKIYFHWYIACLESELKNKPIRRIVYGQPYVLYRDQTGQVRVFEDRCPHRGAALSSGRVENGCLRCPYHGWLFHSDGHIQEIPSNGPDKNLENNKGLRPVPCKTQQGAIWIWPAPAPEASDSEESQRYQQGPTWNFPHWKEGGWHGYFMLTDFDNDVNHLVQNFMDVPHTVFVHNKWFRKRKLLQVPITVKVSEGRVKVTYHQQNDSIGFWGRILNSSNAPTIHTDEFIFPNITRVDYQFGSSHFIINSQCTPVDRYKTRVYTWINYKTGLFSLLMKPFFQFYTRQVIEQDVVIMKNQGDNLKKFEQLGLAPEFNAKNGYQSTAADELHIAIDKMREMGRNDSSLVSKYSFEKDRVFWI